MTSSAAAERGQRRSADFRPQAEINGVRRVTVGERPAGRGPARRGGNLWQLPDVALSLREFEQLVKCRPFVTERRNRWLVRLS